MTERAGVHGRKGNAPEPEAFCARNAQQEWSDFPVGNRQTTWVAPRVYSSQADDLSAWDFFITRMEAFTGGVCRRGQG